MHSTSVDSVEFSDNQAAEEDFDCPYLHIHATQLVGDSLQSFNHEAISSTAAASFLYLSSLRTWQNGLERLDAGCLELDVERRQPNCDFSYSRASLHFTSSIVSFTLERLSPLPKYPVDLLYVARNRPLQSDWLS